MGNSDEGEVKKGYTFLNVNPETFGLGAACDQIIITNYNNAYSKTGVHFTKSYPCPPDDLSFMIGATGGVATGVLTGFFSTKRVPRPINTPIPASSFPRVHGLLSESIILSSTAWRIAKRTLLGGILFALLECDYRDSVAEPKAKFIGSIVAGAVCGTVFGLRGGSRGAVLGSALFASLPAVLEVFRGRN